MATVWYKTRRWKNLRLQVIKEEPLCKLRLPGCTGISDSADHILVADEYPHLVFERSNVQGSCQHCNYKRGARSMADVERLRGDRPKALEFFDVPRGRT